MRIAILNSFYTPDDVGGAERSVKFLAETFVKSGHQVMVICTGRQRVSESINGVIVERLSVPNLYHPLDAPRHTSAEKAVWHAIDSYNPFATASIRDVLRSFRPDLLHSNTITGFSVAAWSAADSQKIPIVHTLRDYYLLCPNAGMFKRGIQCDVQCASCSVLSLPRASATRKVAAVVGNSEYILQRHVNAGMFDSASKHVVYNAYEPKDGNQDSRDASYITYGYIGRISPTKGIDLLIEAFKQAAGTGPKPARLLIAGAGDESYVAALKKSASTLPIEFVGKVTPQDFYPRLDWCVVPSLWHEPLARVLFESFCHGVPVIASKTGGTAEVVENGVNGFTYIATSVEELKILLSNAGSVTADRHELMRRRCRASALKFTPERLVVQYEEIYCAVAGKARVSTTLDSSSAALR